MTIRCFMTTSVDHKLVVGWNELIEDVVMDAERLKRAAIHIGITKLYCFEKDVKLTEVVIEATVDRVLTFNLRSHKLPITDQTSMLTMLSLHELASSAPRGSVEIEVERYLALVKAAIASATWFKPEPPPSFLALTHESAKSHE